MQLYSRKVNTHLELWREYFSEDTNLAYKWISSHGTERDYHGKVGNMWGKGRQVQNLGGADTFGKKKGNSRKKKGKEKRKNSG